MTEEDAFRQAILTEPDDHVHRLVYADWLLEHDPDREPFVRRQGSLGPSVFTSFGQRLVPIPAGRFRMGSPDNEPDRDPDEAQHSVNLTRPFYLAATPVTVGQFRAFAEATAYQSVAEHTFGVGWQPGEQTWQRGTGYNWRNPGWHQPRTHPVVNLQWDDVFAFCTWLGQRDGREYRLPTEAEWEYACRAGTTTTFSCGESLSTKEANYDGRTQDGQGDWVGATTAVGAYPANAFGLFDLHGNVWEWCSDWYDVYYYERGRKSNPPGPRNGFGRVLRGGSWCNPSRDCRSALRRCGNPMLSRYHDGNTGFRLALSFEKPGKKRGEAWKATGG